MASKAAGGYFLRYIYTGVCTQMLITLAVAGLAKDAIKVVGKKEQFLFISSMLNSVTLVRPFSLSPGANMLSDRAMDFAIFLRKVGRPAPCK